MWVDKDKSYSQFYVYWLKILFMDKLHTYDSTKLQLQQNTGKRMRFLLTVLLLTVGMNVAKGASETTIKSIDFTDATWQSTSFESYDGTYNTAINNIYFKGNKGTTTFSIDTGGLTIKDNNIKETNYWIAIPLTNINGTAKVTVKFPSSYAKAQIGYAIETGSSIKNPTSVLKYPSDGTTEIGKSNNYSLTFDVASTSTTAILYLGRTSSTYNTIESVTITTPVDDGTPTFRSPDGTEILTNTSTVTISTTKTSGTIYYKWLLSSATAPTVSSTGDLTTANGWTAGASSTSSISVTAPEVTSDAVYKLYAVASDGTDVSSVASQTFTILHEANIGAPTITPNGNSAWDGSAVSDIRLATTTSGATFIYKWASEAYTNKTTLANDGTPNSTGSINKATGTESQVLSVIATKTYGGTAYYSDITTATWKYLKPVTLTLTSNATDNKIDVDNNTTLTVSAKDGETDVSGLTYTWSIKSSSSTGAYISSNSSTSSTAILYAGTTDGTVTISVFSAATDTYAAGSAELTVTIGDGTATVTAVSNKTWDFTSGNYTVESSTGKQINDNLEYINGAYVNNNKLYFSGGGSINRKSVHFKVAAGSKVSVVIAKGDDNSAGRTLNLSDGTDVKYQGKVSATEDFTLTTGRFTSETDIYLYSASSGISVNSITVSPASTDKEDITLSAFDKSVTVGNTVSPTITATSAAGTQVSNLSYTYSVSSGSDYITIADDGKITGKAVGTATVDVSFAGDDNYNSAAASFKVTVTSAVTTLDGGFDITKFTYKTADNITTGTGSSSNPTDPSFSVSFTGGKESSQGKTYIEFTHDGEGAFTFTAPTGYAYTSITLTWQSDKAGTTTSTVPVAGTGSTSSDANPYTWTGQSSNVTINIKSPSGSASRLSGITFTYAANAISADETPVTPILSPTPGTVYGPQVVAVSNMQGGVSYYYRIDDSTTGKTSYSDYSTNSSAWTVYSDGISISKDSPGGNITVSVAAVNSSSTDKIAYASGTYNIQYYTAATPTFDKDGSTIYTTEQSLSISSTDGDDVDIFYHIKGTDETGAPSINDEGKWTIYTRPLTITETTTVYAYADEDAYNPSSVASITVTIKEDTRSTPDLSWSSNTATVKYGETLTAPTLTNPNSVPVTYSSSEPRVATIDASGKVTVLGIGTTTISASYVGTSTSTYQSQTVSYTLTVTAAGDKSITFRSSSTSLTDGQNVPNGTVVNLDIKNIDATYITLVRFNDTPGYHFENGAIKYEKENPTGQYLGRGIPVYISNIASTTNGTVSTANYATINISVFDPSSTSTPVYSTSIKLKPVEYTDQPTVPVESPLTSKSESGDKVIMTLSESSTVTGDEGNIVYAKYSNSRTYLPYQLLGEPNISIDTTKTGVFSTIISEARRTTAIQVKEDVTWSDGNQYDVASDRLVAYYEYTPNRHKTRIEATPSPITRDMVEINGGTTTINDIETTYAKGQNTTQQITPSFYVDDVLESDLSSITVRDKKISYSYESDNEDVVTVDNNGLVTIVGPGTTTIIISTEQLHGSALPSKVGTQGYDAATKTISVVITDTLNSRLLPPTFNPPTNRTYHVTFDAKVIANSSNKNNPTSVGAAYYIVETDQSKSYTGEQIVGIVKGTNTTDLTTTTIYKDSASVGGSKNVRLPANVDGQKYTIWAVTYNVANKNSDSPKYSTVATVTYTYQYITVDKPVLKPGIEGIHNLYEFSDDRLTVTASTTTAMASIYYTVDKPNDGVDITNGTLYDGSARIVLPQSAIIRAVAYLDGVYSEVVTYRYRKVKTSLDRPPYTIGDNSYLYDSYGAGVTGSIDNSGTVKIYALADIDGDGKFSDETPIDVLNATANTGGYSIYYTTDGTEPAVSTSTRYTAPLTVDQNITIRAITLAADGSTSLPSRLTITVTNGVSVWLADRTTCDPNNSGQLYNQVISTDSVNENQKTAPPFITITIGDKIRSSSSKKTVWQHRTVNEIYQGHRIDGYGDFDIQATGGISTDANSEYGVLYDHSYAQLPVGKKETDDIKSLSKGVYESTFHLPAHGTFVKFEPKRDGTIYIWCLQNGGLHYSKSVNNQDRFYNQFIRKRPVYLVDEQGRSVEASSITAAGTFDYTNWSQISRDALLGMNGVQDGLTQNLFTQAESQDLYDMYNTLITDNGVSDDTYNLTQLVTRLNDGNHKAAASAGVDVAGDNVVDNTGYCLPSASYMKYGFDVKAGKTYFFFCLKSKVGISALGFKATGTDTGNNTPLILNDASSNSATISGANANTTYNVTVNHSFTKGLWTTLVLPFSVSETQLKEKLGANVDVIHFTKWEGTNDNTDGTSGIIHMTRHYYNQMIVAGTPVFIKPDVDATSVTFNGVHIEASSVETVPNSGSNSYYMMGSYDQGDELIQKYDFYINKRGRLTQRTGDSDVPINGMRAWLRGFKVATQAKAYVAIVNDSETGDVDGIIRVTVDEDGNIIGEDLKDNIIYNLSGQIVTRDPSRLNTLPRGVYILNGKKVTVK